MFNLILESKQKNSNKMRRQKNKFQMKEQGKNPNEMKTSNLPDQEFKVIVIRYTLNLREELNENSTKS